MNRKLSSKILSWLLLILFTYNIVGCYATFFVWKCWMHEQLEELASTLPNEKLTLIELSSNEKIENEICVEGKMYDVIRTESINEKAYVYCLRDFEEETLATTISDDSIFSKAHNDLSKAIKSLQKNSTEKYLSSTNSNVDSQNNLSKTFPFFTLQNELSSFIFQDFPPPKS
jgi:hypothetical protein